MKDIVTSAGLDAGSPVAANEVAVQSLGSGPFVTPESLTLRSHRTQAEIYAIRQALEQTGWIRKRAARMLAISYRSLLYKIQRYKITQNAAKAGNGLSSHEAAGQN